MVLAFLGVIAAAALVALLARRFRATDALPTLAGWALADRSLGPIWIWSLLGGSTFTAYTFVAVPSLVDRAGALGFFALPYTVMMCPIAFVLLPRLSAQAHRHGFVTISDYVRARYGSPLLALVVALTGILASMPYLALQLIGLRAVLAASGLGPDMVTGDIALIVLIGGAAAFTFRFGLRAPTVTSAAKAIGILTAASALIIVVLVRLGGPAAMFAGAAHHAAALGSDAGISTIEPRQYWSFVTLAVGSALALLMYPHVHIAVFAASGPNAVRKASIGLPAWTGVLGVFAFLGVAALATGIVAPVSGATDVLPQLVATELSPTAAGLVFGVIAAGVLIPFTVMSIAAGTSFVRNVYVEYVHPSATPKRQMRIARLVSLVAMAGSVVFVLGLRDQDAINLQLLGGVWILQTLPSVVVGLHTRRLHHLALLAGWAVAMAASTLLVVRDGFSTIVYFGIGRYQIECYIGLAALIPNLAVAVVLSPVLDRLRVPRHPDRTVLPASPTSRPIA